LDTSVISSLSSQDSVAEKEPASRYKFKSILNYIFLNLSAINALAKET
jgi:hypothetical protein